MHADLEAIGIDVGGTNLRLARVAADGTILEKRAERIDRDPEAAIARAIELAAFLDGPDVVAVGVGIPGRVDARRGKVLSGGYLDFAGLDFAERLQAALGKPAAIDNDCNMALVAEIAVGAGKRRDDVVMFTIGTGIGGAVMLEGKIVRGRMAAGQLGHVTVDVGGLPCACGRRGCVETTSSGNAFGRLVAEAGLPAGTTAEAVLAADSAGDPRADTLLRAWATPLRAAIDTVVAAFDPELVLLGGGLGGAAFRALAKAPPLADWYRCAVAPAELGDDAGVIGAALSALIEHHRDGGAQRVAGRGARHLSGAGRS
ncbi:ROK family protein [Oharaeibacter diazotrophicus]|uniref:Putative NBD/HSP70 family sugar kinase n=1 Tax=Oharaeibacter diazotrophicus TaxID=1920512 RepID=A0A4R6R7D9_9HYPH|nr:ROK family protein [Oharaeibacter diazotrophicus]TDP81883.1 putative NBD/HSP70 family sugar kinase [Oharaeibacter diazotrophicus]BBE73515.1 glucokinase [Pleomorphomonas sp. SM30]GLS75304.1 glucokinase [Oharaeibacter diazotrophicus]